MGCQIIYRQPIYFFNYPVTKSICENQRNLRLRMADHPVNPAKSLDDSDFLQD